MLTRLLDKDKSFMKHIFVGLFFMCWSFFSFSQTRNWDDELSLVNHKELHGVIMSTNKVVEDCWDELPQVKFWTSIMRLSPDSSLVNIASTRTIIERISNKDWRLMSESSKDRYRDSIRSVYNLDSTERIYVTTGKNDFYRFKEVYPSLTKGILAFEQNNVDPWYAQAILLIESPAQIRKSVSGAYGPFQLMPGVAKMYGLTVGKYLDERKDFNRSAYAASALLKSICIPSAKKILEDNHYQYNESDLWFRLFVMHIYHAGAGNVRAVVEKIGTLPDGKQLIQQMWQTKAAAFGNNSQNYSQLALAAQYIIHEMTYKNCQGLFDCKEETQQKSINLY